MNGLPFVIAGGGIGGLALAAGLARNGVRCIVLEAAPKLGEIGAGIQIGPNAFHAFDYLGVGDAARSVAVYIDQLRLMNGLTAEEIVHVPLDAPFRTYFGNPYAVVHRADLHGVLLNACRANPLVELRTDHRVAGYVQDEKSVTVFVDGREPITGTALVGADGLRSAVRQQLVGDGEPRVSGHTTYRSVIPTDQMPEDLRWNAATLWAGPKCHIVHYPLKGWKVFNLVVTYHNDVTEASAGVLVDLDEVRNGFQHVAPKARRIIEQGSNWMRWVLCDRDPIENWVEGRVALLGDAAHPMLQYMAQGACMALEDAVCLSHVVAGRPHDVAAVLQDYQHNRIARTARVQMSSRLMGEFVYHPAGAKALVRDTVLRAMTPEEFYFRLSWLYGGTGLDAAARPHPVPKGNVHAA